jgi:hypothetical protein
MSGHSVWVARFEGTEPVMDAGFREPVTALGREDIRAGRVRRLLRQIGGERPFSLAVEVDVPCLAALVADVKPALRKREVGVGP